MKKLYILLIVLVGLSATLNLSAQAFKMQILLRNDQGNILENQQTTTTVSIYDTDDNLKYSEVHNIASNPFGVIETAVGNGLVISGSIGSIDWSQPHYISLQVDYGTGIYELPYTPVYSVPAAEYAKSAGTVNSIDWSQVQNTPQLFSGDYNDLTNQPLIFSGDYNDLYNQPSLFSGSYNDLTDKPVIPTPFSGDYNDLDNTPILFSGDYNDLLNQPALFSGDYSDLSNKPTLFSGNYSDLSGTPVIADTLGEMVLDAQDNNITNLAAPVNNTDAVTKEYVDQLFAQLTNRIEVLEEAMIINGNMVTDHEGNKYRTAQFGNQRWMLDNLKTKTDPHGTHLVDWMYPGEERFDPFTEPTNEERGLVYTWRTAMHYTEIEMTQGMCPTGWHIPSQAEWDTLVTYLSGQDFTDANNDAGTQMRSTRYWEDASNATNATGFSIIPAGFTTNYGTPHDLNTRSNIWTSTMNAFDYVYYIENMQDDPSIMRMSGTASVMENSYKSIRCLED